ncbi:unnamed protein product, partial [marine sediment metagenome]
DYNFTHLSNFTDDILWTSSFNDSITDSAGAENVSWNESGARDIWDDYNYNMSSPYDEFNYNMSEATFDYNMTDGVFDIYGEWFYNMSSPYDVFNYNMTDTTFDYNMTRTDAEVLKVCDYNYTLLSNFTDDILWT